MELMRGINFPIKAWYHLLIALGIAGAAAALTVDLKGIQNTHALLVSLGVLLVGIGEWINHPYQAFLSGSCRGHPRNSSALGVLCDIAGMALFAVGVWKIMATA
jgi:hypothetical protein